MERRAGGQIVLPTKGNRRARKAQPTPERAGRRLEGQVGTSGDKWEPVGPHRRLCGNAVLCVLLPVCPGAGLRGRKEGSRRSRPLSPVWES